MSRRSRDHAHFASTSVSIERSVLLWCMRVWMHGASAPNLADHHIGLAFSRIGSAEAAGHFTRFMHALAEGALAPIAVQCVCWRGVAEDEHALLDCFALAQERRSLEAMMLLRGFLTPGAAGAAVASAACLGAALAQVGWFLSAPAPDIAHFAMAPNAGMGQER